MNCPTCKIEMKLVEENELLWHKCEKCGCFDAVSDIKVEAMYGFFSVDPRDGNEGLVAFKTPEGFMPLVGADLARVEAWKKYVEKICKDTNVSIRLYKFGNKELLQEFLPDIIENNSDDKG